jgi:hypothetical protein
MTNLPVVAEGIDHASQPPAVVVLDGNDNPGTGRNRLREHRIGIRNGQDHPDSTTAQRLGTVVPVLGGLVAHPELRAIDRQLGYDCPAGSTRKSSIAPNAAL